MECAFTSPPLQVSHEIDTVYVELYEYPILSIDNASHKMVVIYVYN